MAAHSRTTLCFQVFQCLLIEGENSGEDALREAAKFVISDEEFEGFLERHKEVSCLVPESNQKVVKHKHHFAHHHTVVGLQRGECRQGSAQW